MNSARIASCMALGAAMVMLSACGDAADKLSDGELRSLLRSDSASATDVNPPIDRAAVECLSAWSGDSALIGALPAGIDTTAVKANCRQRVEGWLADNQRNPHELAFSDIATAPFARRAMTLLDQPAATAAVSTAAKRLPSVNPALVPGAVRGQSLSNEQSFNGQLAQYESLCKKAKDVAATVKSPPMALTRRINNCLQRAGQMSAQMNAASSKGNAFETSMLAQNAERAVAGAQRLVDEAQKAAGGRN